MEETMNRKTDYQKIGNCLVIYITDELDHHMVEKLREVSDTLIKREQIKDIIFDFTDVGFMDSSGIGMIMGRYKRVMFSGGRAAVTNVGEIVNRIFLLSGLYQIIEKYPTVEKAVEAMQKKRSGGDER